MRIPSWLIDQVRQLGRELTARPENFTGNVSVNALEGGITNLNFTISFRPFPSENGVTNASGRAARP